MTKSKKYGYLLILASLLGMVGVSAVYVWSVQRAVRTSNTRWVSRVAEMIVSERLSFSRWLDQFPASRGLLSSLIRSKPDLAAVFIQDTRAHETIRWVRPELENKLRKLDSRLVVLQLKVLETKKPEVGPVVFVNDVPYVSAVRPLDPFRSIAAMAPATGVQRMLEDETRLWHLDAAIYDYERHRIFASQKSDFLTPLMRDIVLKVQNGARSGIVALPRPQIFQALATYHYDPLTDWVFVVSQPAAWVYFPVFLFLAAAGGMFMLSRLPWKGIELIREKRVAQQLSEFAIRVDGFIRGRDVKLSEPPYEVKELAPIVHALRWLMPQWKRAEAIPGELAVEKELLTLLVESLPEGILFFNEKGSLQMGNELGRVFMQMQQEAGREYKMVSGVQVPRGFLEPFVEPVFTKEQKNLGKEVEVGWADGKHLYRVWVEGVEQDGGNLLGFIVVVRDITFRKQWEAVQEQLLSGITHDLRGPLSAVMGYLDLMRRQVPKDASPKLAEYLKLAREAGVRLSQMVNDILDAVRFEQGKVDLQPESILVQDIFQNLKNIFGVTAEQKKVRLEFDLGSAPMMKVWADPKLLERVLDNLIGNAIKFTPSGGNISVVAQRDGRRTVFCVSDTGRGIPKEAQSRIFDKFQQVRPGDRSSGYGLGLAVAKFIIEAHKGEIRVESELGKGSQFTFWIPDAAAGAALEPPHQASANA